MISPGFAPTEPVPIAPEAEIGFRATVANTRPASMRAGELSLLAFGAAHAPLAVMMRASSSVATLHGLLVIALGVFWGVSGQINRVAYLGAYIAGSELLWRMAGGALFWEAGKYALCIVFLVALMRSNGLRPPLSLVFYFGLLLPSVLVVIGNFDLGRLRRDLSFNLSGALSLTISGWFYSRLEISREEFIRFLLIFLAPVMGISSLALLGLVTAEKLEFTEESSFLASGGFGPNQVSTILGLGALACFLCVLLRSRGGQVSLVLLGLIVFYAGQSALTFSRTGVYCAVGGILACTVSLMRDPAARVKLVLTSAVVAVASYFLLIPFLDTFTDGHISKRFSESNSSGREILMQADLELFCERPVMGVGPGGSKAYHITGGQIDLASHSEVTRLVAEHGMLGMFALMLLLGMAWTNYRRQAPGLARSVAAAIISWSLLIMASNAMRISAPSLMFGLSFSYFALDPRDDNPQ